MRTNGTSAMHYTLKDHQGSLTATVCGNAVERQSYDAWGRRRIAAVKGDKPVAPAGRNTP